MRDLKKTPGPNAGGAVAGAAAGGAVGAAAAGGGDESPAGLADALAQALNQRKGQMGDSDDDDSDEDW